MNIEKTDIVIKAHELFIRNGYLNTTITMIADQLGIEPSVIRTYFPDKESIAIEMFAMINDVIGNLVDTYVEPQEDPLLFCAVTIYFEIHYYYDDDSQYRNLFLIALQDGFYKKAMYRFPIEYMQNILAQYDEYLTADEVHLYRDIIPNAVARSIILGKQIGQFKDTDIEELTELIVRAHFDRFIPHEKLNMTISKAYKIAPLILMESRNTIPAYCFKNHVNKYNLKTGED